MDRGRVQRWGGTRCGFALTLPLVLVVAGVVAVVLVLRSFTVRCVPDTPCVTLADLRAGRPLPAATVLYDRDGEVLAEVAGPLRQALETEEFPELLSRAFVVVEDRRFWDHGGVDARGVLRAAVRNLLAGEVEEGASTIPMQLVRTLWGEYLREVGPWRRKVIEARTAPRLIRELGHERVLTLYMNAIYLGDGIYGVQRASLHYFGKGVDRLDPAEIATLVGMTQGPERYHPRRHPERARARRDVVLGILAAEGVLPDAEVRLALDAPLDLPPPPESAMTRSYMSAAVMRELRRVAADAAGSPGLKVFTTIDREIQREAERALLAQLEAIEAGRYGRFVPVDPEEAEPAAAEGVSDGAERAGDGGSGAEGSGRSSGSALLQGAAVALDPGTGAVRAWIGGRDFSDSEFDRVALASRQVGSLVKPFVVASALEKGIGILDPVSADTVPIETESGAWLPADHVEEAILPLREALVRSSNRAAANVADEIGIGAVQAVARGAGIESSIPSLPSSSIGAFGATLLEMTAAYAVFGNGGVAIEPHLIRRIEDHEGAVVWAHTPDPRADRALDEEISFVVLDALRDVVDRGTGYAVRSAGYYGPAAGKTGTTNEGRDAWFVGLTPGLVAGVWIGFDRPRPIVGGLGGGVLAAPAWGRWMRGLERAGEIGQGAWIPPVGLERVRYDPLSGQVAGEGCPAVGAEREAWVRPGEVDRSSCRGGVLGFFRKIWQVISPPKVEPIGARRSGG